MSTTNESTNVRHEADNAPHAPGEVHLIRWLAVGGLLGLGLVLLAGAWR